MWNDIAAAQSGRSERMASRKSHAGFTLVEVVMALGILSAIALGSFYTFYDVSRANRASEKYIAASGAVQNQLNFISGIARNITTAGITRGMAGAPILYFQQMAASRDDADDFRIALDGQGVLSYEFPVPVPGQNPNRLSGGGALETNVSNMGRGLVKIYLNEANVPSYYSSWNNLSLSGSQESTTPGGTSHYNMGEGGDASDYSSLFTATSASAYETSDLRSLPFSIEIRYYSTAKALQNDLKVEGPGFRDVAGESQGWDVRVERFFVINDSVGIPLGV